MVKINNKQHVTKDGMVKKNPKSKFNQIVVWRGTIVGNDKVKDFEKLMKTEGFRVKYIKEIKTYSGRNDILFYIHDEDISKFAVRRFKWDMSWLEDALNNSPNIYSDEIHKMRKW